MKYFFQTLATAHTHPEVGGVRCSTHKSITMDISLALSHHKSTCSGKGLTLATISRYKDSFSNDDVKVGLVPQAYPDNHQIMIRCLNPLCALIHILNLSTTRRKIEPWISKLVQIWVGSGISFGGVSHFTRIVSDYRARQRVNIVYIDSFWLVLRSVLGTAQPKG